MAKIVWRIGADFFGGLGQISLEDCGRFLWRIVADFFGVCDVRE